mmetsp:Transcript_39905/g.100341  ORF Transcript_39905/g.100341 Transcript_39905/m.100341 type:complete len:555 (-) Transcript_39905:305-1969(-)|eukprot:jgi/Tetstr1/435180/TSEL_002636.t1
MAQQAEDFGCPAHLPVAPASPGAVAGTPAPEPASGTPMAELKRELGVAMVATSSRGRALKVSPKAEEHAAGGDIPFAPVPPAKKEGRGRWDGALSPATPGIMPPEDQIKPLPMLPGGGGIFKSAAVAILRDERRLMSTGEITKVALQRGYIRCQGRTPEATMASALYTDVKKKGDNSYFSRPEEGLFGLREWEVGATPLEEPALAAGPPLLAKPPLPKAAAGKPKRAPRAPKRPRASADDVTCHSGEESEEHVSSRSMDENLLLLLDAADELQKAESESKSAICYEYSDQRTMPLKKRRWSETGTATSPAPKTKVRRPRPQGIPPRAPGFSGRVSGGQLIRPKPIQLPLDKSAKATALTLVPLTPNAEAETSPCTRPAGSPVESHDSQASTRHDAPARSLYGTTTETSCEAGDCEETATSVGGGHLYGELSNTLAKRFTEFAQHGVARPGDVGRLLAASQFATKLLHTNGLVAQMEQALGNAHPLVGKVYLAKARICQMEGSQLALLEAERALIRAKEILNSAHPESVNIDAEVSYLLIHIRERAYAMQEQDCF